MAGIVSPSGDVMQRSVSHPTPAGARVDFRPLRLLAASAALALASGLMQTVAAAPYSVHGGPGTVPAMGQMGRLLMAHPRQMELLFDGIGASAEQRVQIQQIAQAARADLRAQREAGQDLREQGRALFVQPVVDEAAVETLRLQALAHHDQASRRMVRALLDVSRVLTGEQRQALAEQMAEHRATLQRHRAEREAASNPKH
jgi:Spy/CpxP family protein refolding chaperone